MYKHLYSRFLAANPGVLHFAAHSHYYWPDVTRDAQLQYWDDSARLVDGKWDHILGQIIPQAQNHLADRLQTGQPRQIVFAPNTHELVCRVLSCFTPRQPVKIVTTDSEFYSFDRQVKRLEEVGMVEVLRVSAEPFETFEDRLLDGVRSRPLDLAFVSAIFFNSGLGLSSLNRLAEATRLQDCTLVVDGYHALGAVPVDLSQLKDDLFYLGGSYKYLQSGEGACFMHVPKGSQLVPTNTGWFAEFADLAARDPECVGFAEDGWRFAGATFDPSGIYRLNSVMQMFDKNGLCPSSIHRYITGLQNCFLEKIEKLGQPGLRLENLVDSHVMQRGHLLAFDLGDSNSAKEMANNLSAKKIRVDVRNSRIRFGFGLYQDESDLSDFFQRLTSSP